MDEKQKRYILIAAGVLFIILLAVAAANMHKGEKTNTTTTTQNSSSTIISSQSTTSSSSSTTTSTQTTSTTTSTQTTTTTPTSTPTVTTSYEITTITTTTEMSFIYEIPLEVMTPVTGSFTENIHAYGISVSTTDYERSGVLLFDGTNLTLSPESGNPVIIMPLTISGVATEAKLTVGNAYAYVPVELAYFPGKAFESAEIGSVYITYCGAMADYTTVILGNTITGKYCYSDKFATVVMSFPYTYTLDDGVVFEVTGTFTITYSVVTGETTSINSVVTYTTTSTITVVSTITP